MKSKFKYIIQHKLKNDIPEEMKYKDNILYKKHKRTTKVPTSIKFIYSLDKYEEIGNNEINDINENKNIVYNDLTSKSHFMNKMKSLRYKKKKIYSNFKNNSNDDFYFKDNNISTSKM